MAVRRAKTAGNMLEFDGYSCRPNHPTEPVLHHGTAVIFCAVGRFWRSDAHQRERRFKPDSGAAMEAGWRIPSAIKARKNVKAITAGGIDVIAYGRRTLV
jgi:hypothetical protein